MRSRDIDLVLDEMARLAVAITELRRVQGKRDEYPGNGEIYTPETGRVRQVVADLTRALTQLRDGRDETSGGPETKGVWP